MDIQKLASLPENIKEFVDKRNRLRDQKLFEDADKVREEIEELGYVVIDEKGETKIFKKQLPTAQKPKRSFIVLFGSGEISPTGRKIHDHIFSQIDKKYVNIAILTTPAGFQPNVKVVYEEIAQFFSDGLKNYHPNIKIVYVNTKHEVNNAMIVDQIIDADYIFTGPGSPTYALNNLKNSLLLQRVEEKIKNGTTLSLASAAAIAFSHLSLPVYEIYKVGTDLYWEKGINLYEIFFKKLTVIPHLNNEEGGEKTDTSYCFMGKERFDKLTKLLPDNEEVWGIDEHTALIVDLQTKQYSSMGKGKLHILKTPSLS